ncbi:MAG TPA: FKBP-type peptidyl-prolyl cis-trans isomerase [Phycisphaerae bacterium]|nr:FKBP-type peptidyl-prolyl cis-trans isomerase [Phycisphaerae bacterium]
MKTFVLAATIAILGAGTVIAETPTTAPTSTFKTDQERVGYAIGLQIGKNLSGIDFDTAALAAGIKDSASGAKPQMSDDEIRQTLTALKQKMMAKQEAAAQADAKAGDTFLVENAKKPGVVTTASGLQYKINSSGKGKQPKATDTVSVNYRGTLVSGKEFDASHGTPVTFPVNGVIPGWTEALQLMHEGDKWTLYIPAKLAYGEQGAGPDIGPNQTLIFDVELVSVK